MAEQGYYGTETNPVEDIYSERKVMTPHSSDPGSLEEGEYRLRTDLNSGDRIATYELNVGNGVEEAPIFPLSESVGSNIVKVRHVYVPGEGWGFVPLGDTSVFTPAYEEFAFWHNNTRYGWHDSTTSIPGSVVLQYYATTWDQGDGTWNDDAGTAENMTLSGDPQAAMLSDGSESVSLDGSGDYGTVTLPSSLEGSNMNEFAVEFAIEYTTADADAIFGVQNSDSTPLIWPRVNQDEEFNSDEGNLFWALRDANDNRLTVAPSTNPNLNDGNRHNISFVVNDASTADVEIIIDGTSVSLSTNSAQSDNLTNWGTFNFDCAFGARNDAGTITEDLDCEIGAIRWHDSAIASQTIDDYP